VATDISGEFVEERIEGSLAWKMPLLTTKLLSYQEVCSQGQSAVKEQDWGKDNVLGERLE